MASIDVEIGLIGGAEMRDIVLCDYNPGWPDQYESEVAKIRRAMGNRVLQIEHIGSTSVPLLAAKPIIDILLIIADPSDEVEYLPALLEAGYQLRVREPEDDQHRMFRTPERARGKQCKDRLNDITNGIARIAHRSGRITLLNNTALRHTARN